MSFGGGSGSSSISGSTDVVLNSPANNNVLGYNSGLAKWQNQDLRSTYVSAVVVPAPSGSAATDTANLTAAINTGMANLSDVVLQAGDYNVNATLPTITKAIGIRGPGAGICRIISTASGDTLRIQVTPFTTVQAGSFKGFTVQGSSAPAGAVGVHLGDTTGFTLDDIIIRDYLGTGSTGLWMDNRTNWTERTRATGVHFDNNTVGIRCSVNGGTTSFGYTRLSDVRFNINAGQTGLQIENASIFYAADIVALANCSAAAPTLINMMDTSLLNGRIFMGAEGGTTATRFAVASDATVRLGGWVGFPGSTDAAAGSLAIGVQQQTLQVLSGTTVNSTSWQFLGYAVTLPAAVGDLVTASFTCLVNNDASRLYIDFATLNGAALPVNQFSTEAAVDNANGGLMAFIENAFWPATITASKRLTTSDIVNGIVTVSPVFRIASGAGRNINGSTVLPARTEVVCHPGDISVV
jgi:hypothetical protein